MTSEPRLLRELGAELGEGPVWVGRDEALWFTDIKRQKIYRFDPKTGDQRSWDSPEQIGFVLPTSRGFVAGLQSGLHRFDPERATFETIVEVEPDLVDNRLNDGVVDPSGRLWFGTMDNLEKEPSGGFYSYAKDELHRTSLTGICITNGPAVSPDGRTLYWVDTFGGTISACEIGPDGELGPSQLIVRIDKADGFPDGPTVDSEGCIWIGLYSGWEVRRYSPAGEMLDRVRFPVANITKIAFGGTDLRTAFATTARQFLTDEELKGQPLAGGLFAFDVDVPGVPCSLIED